jgi:hypothetical protein
MSGLNKRTATPLRGQSKIGSPVRAERVSSGRTRQGGAGYAREAKGELFLLAVSSFAGEDKFYERASAGTQRFVKLVHEVSIADSAWTAQFLNWLRNDAYIRTAAIVGAAEYANAWNTARRLGSQLRPAVTVRVVIDSVLQRADEPGEFVAYWRANIQPSLPAGVQRAVADAVLRLYTERSYLKWDSQRDAYRFADVLNIVHAVDAAGSFKRKQIPWKGPWQRDLFGYIVKRAYEPGTELPDSLLMIEKNRYLRSIDDPRAWLDPTVLRDAGMTWEDALSALGNKVSKKDIWTAIAPSMGVMALLRNLRNIDEAKVSDEIAEALGRVISSPEEIAKSKQLPMRFLSAYRAVKAIGSVRWLHPLEKALQLSLSNVPYLTGRTLILVDTSSSMTLGFSKDGTVKRWDAAVLFALALAERCDFPEVVSFSSNQMYTHDRPGARTKTFSRRAGEALLSGISRWEKGGFFLGGGTETAAALRQHYKDHERVVILTDEQANSDGVEVSKSMRADRPLHTINLAGYERGHAPSTGLRFTFGGLSDSTFHALSLAEAGALAKWPWEN